MRETPAIDRRGLLLVLSSPSGAGKTTLARRLITADSDISMSVSVTTRKPRPGEVEGQDYYFVDEPTFKRMADDNELLEWARVFDNYYGTSRKQVEERLAAGENVLLEIDWQGAQQIRRAMPEARTIFVLPPSRAALEQRLRGRATDSEEVIARRLKDSIADMSHWNEFDYVVVNDDMQRCFSQIYAILTVERLKRERQPWISACVRRLQSDL